MPAPVLTVAAVVICPHGGGVAMTGTTSRVLIGGMPALTVAGPAMVQNCALAPAQACASVTWQAGASRVFAGGQPVLVQTSTGTCLSSAGQPTGSPLVVTVQSRVIAQ
jgi:hypothetical protein